MRVKLADPQVTFRDPRSRIALEPDVEYVIADDDERASFYQRRVIDGTLVVVEEKPAKRDADGDPVPTGREPIPPLTTRKER